MICDCLPVATIPAAAREPKHDAPSHTTDSGRVYGASLMQPATTNVPPAMPDIDPLPHLIEFPPLEGKPKKEKYLVMVPAEVFWTG